MRVAFLSPLPPARTGIAHYASMVLPALRERLDVTAFDSLDGYDRAAFEVAIYQMGNNPHHEWIYREAMQHPGVVVLHDLVLHHLIVEMTLARGDAEAYVAALEASHGAAGAAWARGRAAGLHSEMGNFLLPASIELANRSRAVIVHNQYAAGRLRSFGVTAHVVPHPYVPLKAAARAAALHTIGFFGFLTSAKRAEVILEAFRIARARDPRLRLLIVGEPAPNIDVRLLQQEGVTLTGYVPDEEFGDYYARADRLVNLRYPSAGETSGTLIRAFDAGKPVAVSDYAQFAELPDDCVVKIPFGEREIPSLVDFFLADLPSPAPAQRAWLESNARLDLTMNGYVTVVSQCGAGALAGVRGVPATLPLFPNLTYENGLLRNTGPSPILTRTYGTPSYRLIAKYYAHDQLIADRWLTLPRDLNPGETTNLQLPTINGATRVTLSHALESIPMLDPAPFAEIPL